jgi:ABC-2 type transport system permease protein
VRALRELAWVELKLFVREPLSVVFVLVLPLVMLYVLNGVFGGDGPDPTVWEGRPAVDFYVAAYVALVAATVGVLAVPVHLAGYREQGVLRRFQASPLPPMVLVGAHTLVASVIAAVAAALLTVTATLGFGAPWPESWAGVLAAFLIVTVAFTALGALLGFLLPTARAAQGLGVLLFFVFLLLGGAGPPREVLPGTLGAIADVLPITLAGHLLRDPWLGRGWDLTATWGMTGVLVACVGLTAWRLRGGASR